MPKHGRGLPKEAKQHFKAVNALATEESSELTVKQEKIAHLRQRDAEVDTALEEAIVTMHTVTRKVMLI